MLNHPMSSPKTTRMLGFLASAGAFCAYAGRASAASAKPLAMPSVASDNLGFLSSPTMLHPEGLCDVLIVLSCVLNLMVFESSQGIQQSICSELCKTQLLNPLLSGRGVR